MLKLLLNQKLDVNLEQITILHVDGLVQTSLKLKAVETAMAFNACLCMDSTDILFSQIFAKSLDRT